MYIIEWKPEYSIGEKTVDLEHQRLFAMAQKALHLEINQPEEIFELLAELQNYIVVHFRHEEEYMRKVNYPRIQEHMQIHKRITDEVELFIQDCQNMSVTEIQKALSDFVQINILHHIVIEDKKIHFWTSSSEDLIEQIGWKSFYEIDSPELDREHKELFDLSKEIFDTCHDKTSLLESLEKASQLVISHFYTEEEYMKNINYPEFEEHQEIHQKVMNDLQKLIIGIEKDTLDTFKKKLVLFVEIWLVNHVVIEDKKIIQWQRSNKG